MTWRADLWDRFAALQFCWMHAMVALRLFFAVMRFIIEPLVLHRRMAHSSKPAAYFQRMERLHRILLVLSLDTLEGAAGGGQRPEERRGGTGWVGKGSSRGSADP